MVSALPLLLLLSLSASSCCLGAHANAAAGHHGLGDFMAVEASSLKHVAEGAVCSGHKVTPSGNSTWAPLNRPHGPCSSSSTRPDDGMPAAAMVGDMLLWDQRRTSSIRRQISGEADAPIIDDHTADTSSRDYSPQSQGGVGEGGGNSNPEADSAATGNSGVRQTVVIDTSSDIPWVQCVPCPAPQCHPQKDTLYDPTKSTASAPIRCGSPACAQLSHSYGNGCSRSQECQYIVNYGDGRVTTGTYVTDTLTLSSNFVVKNFRFGCSHAVRGTFSDQTAGVLSLGGGAQSLLAQTARTYGNAFSYCIPQPSSTGFLSMGGPLSAATPFARTPLVKNPRAPATFYVVRLQAITVAGQTLNVPPAVFSAGSVVDSSAVVTQLPPTAYHALRAAFRRAMGAYPLTAPVRNLDTCYDFTRFPMVTVPRVSLVFNGGATLQLDATSVMINGCLAFAASPSDAAVGFIGNVQQQTYEVLYDVAGGAVGFRPGAC